MDREYMQEVINGMRKIVKPYLAKQLKKINFEGCGNTDKAEFETDFEIVLTLAEKALAIPSAEPCDDTVSRGVFEQVKWERDIAIEQLNELGYELGQKIEPCEDAISREDVINLKWQGEASEEFLEGYANAIEDARVLPPVKKVRMRNEM